MCHCRNEAREKTSWGERWAQGGNGAKGKIFLEENVSPRLEEEMRMEEETGLRRRHSLGEREA